MGKETGNKYLIGIDPGASTGVCLYLPKTRAFSLHTIKPWKFQDLFEEWNRPNLTFHAFMEDPRQNKPVFNRYDGNLSQKQIKKMMKISQNVGSVKRDTDWLEQVIKYLGIKLTLIKPTDSKWTKKEVKVYTGYTGESNEHTRDALRMVYGR